VGEGELESYSPLPNKGEGLGVRVEKLAAHSFCENESALLGFGGSKK